MAHIELYKQADQDLRALSQQQKSADNEALGWKSSFYITQVAQLTQQSTTTTFNNAVHRVATARSSKMHVSAYK